MFANVYENDEKKNKRNQGDLNSSTDNNIEKSEAKKGRNDRKNVVSEIKKFDLKSLKIFESEDKGDSERRIRRNKRNIKTLGYFSIGAVILISIAVILIAVIPKKNSDDNINSVSEPFDEIQKNVIIYYNGDKLDLSTDAETVGELLKENEIILEESQKASYNNHEIIFDGMEIYINNPITVFVINKGITNSITVYGGRVKDILEKFEIVLDEYDIVEPDSDTFVEDQMKIYFTDIEIKEVSVVEDIPYETEEGETSTVERGYYHEEQEGRNGTVQVTYEVRYSDGIEQSRQEISREVIDEPLSRIILWGTANPSDKNTASDGGTSDNNSDDSDNGNTDYDDIKVKNPGEQATNPSVPPAPSDYIEIMLGHVTAYTHTGNTTATGTWPRSTRTLDNPGTCAVVPGTIPYGSLLYVTGYGYCIAEDTGGFRNDPDRWNQIDLFMNTREECIIWGRRLDVNVYILRKGY